VNTQRVVNTQRDVAAAGAQAGCGVHGSPNVTRRPVKPLSDAEPVRAAGTPETITAPGTDEVSAPLWRRGFNERLLGGVVLLTLVFIVLASWLYLTPADYLQVPELQPALRVASEGAIPVGGSRVVTWGPRVILVVRSGESTYSALEGVSPVDGCILRWDAESMRVVSPCAFVVYDLNGNVVRGLTRKPLQRYAAFPRQGSIFVIGS
jgi:hypothetical protein